MLVLFPPTSANLTHLLTRVGKGGGRCSKASVAPFGVEVGAGFVAHGDQRSVNTQGGKLFLVT